MINFDDSVNENIKECNSNCPKISDHRCGILIIARSESGKLNSLFNTINKEPDIDKTCLYTKDPYQAKYQLLINKQESTDPEDLINTKSFIEYSNNVNNIHKNIEEYNPNKRRQILIVFSMIGLLICLVIKKLNSIVAELFIRGRKLKIYLVCYHVIILSSTKRV